ncbi:tetratricopeptide repeat protein [Allomuricauda sp. F6463D]|uniref:tetratricopeptide repeat protein n=1 Tax=Allomuricauda sp. F6463D TaxID=2926409 RepID=UPI001FF113BE|nr:tetratricopeptide repeat protein [Muricauda sp. F6463D]MCK0159618.1 tetratricopeptide repeat protein [Muricauda sp. F6463D]
MSDPCIQHIENYWKIKTTDSNELFNKGSFKAALTGYEEALYRAEVLNTNFADCIRVGIPFLQIYIISCNNIANTYEELHQYEKAENILKRIIYFLLHFEGNKILDSNEIQSELKRASLTYVSFTEKNNLKKLQQEHLFRKLKERFVTN